MPNSLRENPEQGVLNVKEINEYADKLERNKYDDNRAVSDLYKSQLRDLFDKTQGIFVRAGRTMHFPKVQNQVDAKKLFREVLRRNPYEVQNTLQAMSAEKKSLPETNEKELQDLKSQTRQKVSDTLQAKIERRERGHKAIVREVMKGNVVFDR